MANHIFAAVLLSIITVSCAPASTMPMNEPPLVLFVSEQGGFDVLMPVAGEIIQHSTTRTLFGKPIECLITFSRLSGASVMVQYCDLHLENIASLTDEEILDEVRDAVRGEFHMSINEEQTYLVDNIHPALTFSGEEDMRGLGLDGKFKARILLVQNRIYSVHMSVHYENWCNCLHQIDQVVDSFHISPNLTIPFEPTP